MKKFICLFFIILLQVLMPVHIYLCDSSSEQRFISSANQIVEISGIGGPKITGISQNSAKKDGAESIIIKGENFLGAQLVLGDSVVTDFTIVDDGEIRFTVPPQIFVGSRTLTVVNTKGFDQIAFDIKPKPLSELNKGEITSVAGADVVFIGDNTLATSFFVGLTPSDVAIDSQGNLFIADIFVNRVRRVDAVTGIITTIAGNEKGEFSGDDGLAMAAGLVEPAKLVIDKGNLFIIDDLRVRQLDLITGIITTVAGNGEFDFSKDGKPAIETAFDFIQDLVIDNQGNLFIAEKNRVRRVDATTKIVTTVAGKGCEFSNQNCLLGDGGPAIDAGLECEAIVVDKEGNLFISGFGRIRKVDATTKIITTVARVSSDEIILDNKGNLLFVDGFNNRIRQLDLITGIITTIVGNGKEEFSGDGGPATEAGLSSPNGLTIDEQGNLFIADFSNNRVRRVDVVTGIITTVAGSGKEEFNGDGTLSTSIRLNSPSGLAIDSVGNLFIADLFNNKVRRVDAVTGIITTVAGTGKEEFGGDGGPATEAGLLLPFNLVIDDQGNLFISDFGNNRVRQVDAATGVITTFAGSGCDPRFDRCSFKEGDLATKVGIKPEGITLDKQGNLFIADSTRERVWKVDALTKRITTFAGGGTNLKNDGIPATEAANLRPGDVTFDSQGNLFIVDAFDGKIRRVDIETNIITTIAGNGCDFRGQNCPLGDGGIATAASFRFPQAIAIDKKGNLFISDTGNDRIRRIDAKTKIITTVVGGGDSDFDGDGGLATSASLAEPKAMVIGKKGNLFIADRLNNKVRVVKAIAAKK